MCLLLHKEEGRRKKEERRRKKEGRRRKKTGAEGSRRDIRNHNFVDVNSLKN